MALAAIYDGATRSEAASIGGVTRVVGNDNTVVLQKVRLQIPPSPLWAHYVRASVRVRRYPDGSHAIFHGPRCIGRYDAAGLSRDEPLAQAA